MFSVSALTKQNVIDIHNNAVLQMLSHPENAPLTSQEINDLDLYIKALDPSAEIDLTWVGPNSGLTLEEIIEKTTEDDTQEKNQQKETASLNCKASGGTCTWLACNNNQVRVQRSCGMMGSFGAKCCITNNQERNICTHGEIRQCGPSTEQGICTKGIQQCSNNAWNNCVGAIYPEEESCNDQIDNNCNGQVDEACNAEQFSEELHENDWIRLKEFTAVRVNAGFSSPIGFYAQEGQKCQVGTLTIIDYQRWWRVTCITVVPRIPPGRMSYHGGFMLEGSWMEKTTGGSLNKPAEQLSISNSNTVEQLSITPYTIQARDPDGKRLRANIDWGDNGDTSQDFIQNYVYMNGILNDTAWHFYAATGTYTITLYVWDDEGLLSTTSKEITVTPSTVYVPDTIIRGSSRRFQGQLLTGPQQVELNQENSWRITIQEANFKEFIVHWGDGTSDTYDANNTPGQPGSANAVAKHTYTTPGIYNITMIAVEHTGVHGSLTKDIGVLGPALKTRFTDDDVIRSTTNIPIVYIPSRWDWYEFYREDTGTQEKYAIGKIAKGRFGNEYYTTGPLYYNFAWWWKVDFGSGADGWVNNEFIDEVCPPLTAEQLSSKERFAEGECIWIVQGVSSLGVASAPTDIRDYGLNFPPAGIQRIQWTDPYSTSNLGIITGSSFTHLQYVWWPISWDAGVRGWSAGNWLASERSKPQIGKAWPRRVTTVEKTKVYFNPMQTQGTPLGEWNRSTNGTVHYPPQFVDGFWWFEITYDIPEELLSDFEIKMWKEQNPQWVGWSKESSFYFTN